MQTLLPEVEVNLGRQSRKGVNGLPSVGGKIGATNLGAPVISRARYHSDLSAKIQFIIGLYISISG